MYQVLCLEDSKEVLSVSKLLLLPLLEEWKRKLFSSYSKYLDFKPTYVREEGVNFQNLVQECLSSIFPFTLNPIFEPVDRGRDDRGVMTESARISEYQFSLAEKP